MEAELRQKKKKMKRESTMTTGWANGSKWRSLSSEMNMCIVLKLSFVCCAIVNVTNDPRGWGKRNEREYIVVNWDEHEILEKDGTRCYQWIDKQSTETGDEKKTIVDGTDEDNEIISQYIGYK